MNRQDQTCKRALAVMRRRYRHLEVTAEEAAFSRAHIGQCPRCLADSAVIREMLENSATPRFDDLSARYEADAILARLASANREVDASSTRTPHIGWVAVGAAASILAVMMGLWFYRQPSRPSAREAAPGAVVEQDESEARAAEPRSDEGSRAASLEATAPRLADRAVRENAPDSDRAIPRFRTGDHPSDVLLGEGIRMLAKPHSEMILKQSDDLAIIVALMEGQVVVSVDPTKSTPVVSVQTRAARVTVTGTLFSVVSTRDEQWVTVLKGEVMVTGRSGAVRWVSAGQRLSLELGRPAPAPVPDTMAASLKQDAEQLGEDERVDAPVLDWRPTAIHGSGNRHRTSPSDYTSTASDPGRGEGRSGASRSAIRTLLLDARRYRRQGSWPELARTYRRLINRHSRTEEAASAMVALADVLLRHLDNPRAALAMYDGYIQSKERTLLEEALIGKADALEGLGRVSEATTVLQTFLTRHPQSIHASAVRHRLDARR